VLEGAQGVCNSYKGNWSHRPIGPVSPLARCAEVDVNEQDEGDGAKEGDDEHENQCYGAPEVGETSPQMEFAQAMRDYLDTSVAPMPKRTGQAIHTTISGRWPSRRFHGLTAHPSEPVALGSADPVAFYLEPVVFWTQSSIYRNGSLELCSHVPTAKSRRM